MNSLNLSDISELSKLSGGTKNVWTFLGQYSYSKGNRRPTVGDKSRGEKVRFYSIWI